MTEFDWIAMDSEMNIIRGGHEIRSVVLCTWMKCVWERYVDGQWGRDWVQVNLWGDRAKGCL